MAIYIEGEKKSTKEVLAELGVNEKDIPLNGKRKVFDTLSKTVDKLNGGFRFNRRVVIKPQFTVFSILLNTEVTVRYAESKFKKSNKNGAVLDRYAPNNIFIELLEDGTYEVSGDKRDLFLYLFLHPSNEVSPFHKMGTPAKIKYQDLDKKAADEISEEELYVSAMSYVIGDRALPISSLRKMAKGLRVAAVDDLTDRQITATLARLAKENPAKFSQDIRANSTEFLGTIQDAIDKGIIMSLKVKGYVQWKFRDEVIVIVPPGHDARNMLEQHFVDNMIVLWDKLKEDVKNHDSKVKSKLETADMEQFFGNDFSFRDEAEHKADLGKDFAESLRLLKELKQDEKVYERVKELAAQDPNDPNMHPSTRRSYEKYRLLIDLVKMEQEGKFEEEESAA